MASPIQRKAAIRAARQRAARRRMYMLAGIAILIIAMGVGAYVYISGQPLSNTPSQDIVHAQINTTKGIIQVELYRSKTPKTVANFVGLANSHFYDNLVWHRIVKDFVIQTGDSNTRGAINSTRNTWGKGGASQTVQHEQDPSLHNYAGYLGMARAGDVRVDPNAINSATSQFYINLKDNLDLDTTNGGYTVFGKVTSGMDVVSAIGSVQTYSASAGPDYQDQPKDAMAVMVTTVTIS